MDRVIKFKNLNYYTKHKPMRLLVKFDANKLKINNYVKKEKRPTGPLFYIKLKIIKFVIK